LETQVALVTYLNILPTAFNFHSNIFLLMSNGVIKSLTYQVYIPYFIEILVVCLLYGRGYSRVNSFKVWIIYQAAVLLKLSTLLLHTSSSLISGQFHGHCYSFYAKYFLNISLIF